MIHFLVRDAQDSAARLMSYRTAAGSGLQGWNLGEGVPVTVASRSELPAGSLVAVRDLLRGDCVLVLGRELGRMTAPVSAGEPIPGRLFRPVAAMRTRSTAHAG